jgi:RHS repeat-associated protein
VAFDHVLVACVGSHYPFLTSKERDIETGLDYFGARYYANLQGRFTGPDAPLTDQSPEDPQSWNLYSYAGNNPLLFFDPNGSWKTVPCSSGKNKCWEAEKGDTLETLATKLGVSANKITKFFPTVDPNNIQVGQIFDVSCLNCNATPVTVIP